MGRVGGNHLLEEVPHRQVVLTLPKRLRIFFRFDRRLLGELQGCAGRALRLYLAAAFDREDVARGAIGFVQTPAARALLGLVQQRQPGRAEPGTTPTACAEPGDEETSRRLSACAEPGEEGTSRRLSWSQLIRKVYEIDPLLCIFCGTTMRIVAFIIERSSLRRILQHLDADCQQPEPLAHSPPAEADLIFVPA